MPVSRDSPATATASLPERYLNNLADNLLAALIAVGLFVGIGQLLVTEKPVGWKHAVGRAMSTIALAVSAGALLALIPAAPPIAVIGVAAGIASLGTSALERVFTKYFGAKS